MKDLKPTDQKVKRMFFEKDNLLPHFELENGDVKRPVTQHANGYKQTLWVTPDEFKRLQGMIPNREKWYHKAINQSFKLFKKK